MKVLLRESIHKLGKRGEVVDVTSGYARNYLLPRALAYPYTQEYQRRLEAEKRKYDVKMAKFKEQREELADRLRGVQMTMTVNATPEGQLYGAIHGRQIAQIFREQGIEMDENSVRLSEPIRKVGSHAVPLHLHAEIDDVEILINVVALEQA